MQPLSRHARLPVEVWVERVRKSGGFEVRFLRSVFQRQIDRLDIEDLMSLWLVEFYLGVHIKHPMRRLCYQVLDAMKENSRLQKYYQRVSPQFNKKNAEWLKRQEQERGRKEAADRSGQFTHTEHWWEPKDDNSYED